MSIPIVLWAVMAAALVLLWSYRKIAARGEDDILHVRDSEVGIVTKQVELDKTLTMLDRWSTTLAVVVLVYGLALFMRWIYLGWTQSQH